MLTRRSILMMVLVAVAVAGLLWPATMIAAPSVQDLFPLYSSYDWVQLKEGLTGPSSCPPQDPFPIFRFGTRDVFTYAAIQAKSDQTFGFLWYELDDQGNPVSDEPIAAVTSEAKAGDLLPYGVLSFTQNVSGNVGVVMVSADAKSGEWNPVANGIFVLAAKGAKVPEPAECPLE